MKIINKGKSLIRFSIKDENEQLKTISINSGENEISDSDFSELEKHPMLQDYIKISVLKIVETPKSLPVIAHEGNSDEGNSDEGNSDEGNSDEGNSDEGNSDEGNSDEGNSDDLELANFTKKELIEFANNKGIDTADLTKAELIEKIKENK
jgi:hypothetical protein